MLSGCENVKLPTCGSFSCRRIFLLILYFHHHDDDEPHEREKPFRIVSLMEICFDDDLIIGTRGIQEVCRCDETERKIIIHE